MTPANRTTPTNPKVKLVILQYGEFEDVVFSSLEELPHHLDQIINVLSVYSIVSIQYPAEEN